MQTNFQLGKLLTYWAVLKKRSSTPYIWEPKAKVVSSCYLLLRFNFFPVGGELDLDLRFRFRRCESEDSAECAKHPDKNDVKLSDG